MSEHLNDTEIETLQSSLSGSIATARFTAIACFICRTRCVTRD